MTNKIKEAVATKLFSNFPNYTNYTNKVQQGFKEPCFFISTLQPNETRVLSGRYFKKTPLVIQCFPGGDNKIDTLTDVAEILYTELEFIEIENKKIMGTKLNYQIIDDVLSFFINYNFFVYRVPSTTEETGYMETLNLDIKVVE